MSDGGSILGDERYLTARKSGIRQQLSRQRALLDRDDRDELTAWEVLECAADQMAARPSADTETLRRVRELADELEGMGLAVFADRIRAALNGDPNP